EPTEQEIRAYYVQTNGSVEGPIDELRPSISRMLHDAAEERAYSNFIQRLRAQGDVKILEPAPHAPVSVEERAKVVATVYGTPISLAEVEDRAAPQLAEIRHEIYEVKRAVLERVVNDALVAARARARGVTPDAYIDAEIAERARPVGHAEAAAYYEAHKADLDGQRLEDVEPRIVELL